MKLPTFSKYFKSKVLTKSYVFDFDDTLFKSNAEVMIRDVKTNKIIKRLPPHKYNKYVKNPKELIDLTEFESESILMKAVPLIEKIAFPALKKADNEIQVSKLSGNPSDTIYILTARGTEVKDAIYKLLKKYRIETVSLDNILTIGQAVRERKTTTALMKHEIVSKIKRISNSVEFYDDNQENINAIKTIKGVITRKV